LSTDGFVSDDDHPREINPTAARWVFLAMLGLMMAGLLAYFLLRSPPVPPPPEVASDPLLLEGRSIYLARCATCHGLEGRGDGPISGHLMGPPVGNLTDGKWKHGDKPRGVMAVISKGVEGTRMAGWGQLLEPSQLRAVTAYVFHLAKLPVPEELRETEKGS
jgi:cytochrome c oxidase cbb3-type subunit III